MHDAVKQNALQLAVVKLEGRNRTGLVFLGELGTLIGSVNAKLYEHSLRQLATDC